MIEAAATVIATEAGYAWLETKRESACGHCAASPSCGASTLGKMLGARPGRLRVADTLALRAGERVVIGIPEERLLGAAFRAYLVPLLWMVGAALAGVQLGFSQWGIGLCSLAALAAGLAWPGMRRRSAAADVEPVLLRRVHDGEREVRVNAPAGACGLTREADARD